eukprot:6199017-Pleurochrysis_carterae.AAC.3
MTNSSLRPNTTQKIDRASTHQIRDLSMCHRMQGLVCVRVHACMYLPLSRAGPPQLAPASGELKQRVLTQEPLQNTEYKDVLIRNTE